MEDVALECGVAKGTCYQHFPARAALLRQAVGVLDDALNERISTIASNAPRSFSRLRATILEAVGAVDARLDGVAGSDQSGAAWPCCLRFNRCPHGGAAKTMGTLRHLLETDAGQPADEAGVSVGLVLAVPVVLRNQPAEPNTRGPNRQEVEATAGRTLQRLVGADS